MPQQATNKLRGYRISYQPNPTGEQLLHHTLLDYTSFGKLRFDGFDFGIHVREDGGDGSLFIDTRNSYFSTRNMTTIRCINLCSGGQLPQM